MPRKWVIGLILAAAFTVFANSLANGFAFDDSSQILQNDLIKSFNNLPEALTKEVWFWRTKKGGDNEAKPSTPYYRPVFILYLMVGWQLFHDVGFGWHLANVLMHLLAVFFVFLILEKVTNDGRLTAISTLLFAIHPLRSESVAWISGVTDLFLALFLLPAFYLYLKYREEGRRSRLIGIFALFVLATFSKEPAICLPAFIAAYEIFIVNQERPLRVRFKRAFVWAAGLGVATVIYFAMRYKALGFLLNDPIYQEQENLKVLLTIPIALIKYLGLLVWPARLSMFHDTPFVASPLDIRFLLPLALLIAICLLLWRIRHIRNVRFAVLWFAINMLPILNLGAFDNAFLVQERYLYVPSIGFSLLLAMALTRIPIERWFSLGSRPVAQATMVAIVAIPLAAKTVVQNRVWADDMSLFTHSAETGQDQPMAHYYLAMQHLKRQDPESMVASLEKYLTLDPDAIVVMNNLAAGHLQVFEMRQTRANLDRAIALCEKGLAQNDRVAPLWDNLGRAYTFETDLKDLERARMCFQRALQIDPNNALFQYHMGATYMKAGLLEPALQHLERARQLQPDFPDTYKFLSYTYLNRGQLTEAVATLSQYLQMRPNGIDAPVESKRLAELRARLQSGAGG